MSPSRILTLMLALPAALPVAAPGAPPSAQDPAARERDRIVEMMKVLRERDADEAARDAAMTELLFLGVEGPKALAEWLERELRSRSKESEKEERRLLAAFEKEASGLLKRRLDGKAWQEVEELRRVVLRNARDPELTKARIEGESDPAVARLEALLRVGAKEVWDAAPELYADWDALLVARDRHHVLLETFGAARAALEVRSEGRRHAERLGQPDVPPTADELLARADALAELVTPMSAADRKALEDNAALPLTPGEALQAGELGPEEQAGVRDLNLRRVLLGLPAQRIDLKLCHACRDHSKDMAELGFFAHESPVEGKTTPWDRAARAGTTAGSENIARGARTGPDAIRQWWYSPGHHRNMMGGGARTGLGRFGDHWTQLFGG
jgi:uncharacterized protein YkwD